MRLVLAMIASLLLGARIIVARPVMSRSSLMRMSSSARPSLDDVERISRGQAAKRRGTGSRGVPHRLNQMERVEWEVAKKRRYLAVRGTGYRKERGDSPLINIYRQLCDSLNVPSITVQRGVQAGEGCLEDIVTIDFSTLRTLHLHEMVAAVKLELERNKDTYPSLLGCTDNTAIGSESQLEYEKLFEDEVIWRIPSVTLVSRFGVRQDSKRFAESIGRAFAGGQVISAGSRGEEGDDDFDL